MINENIALFDLDGSLFDHDKQCLADLERLRSPDEPVIKDLRQFDKTPYGKARMDLVRSIPGWWRNLPRMEDGFEILQLAKSIGFRIKVLTKGPTSKTLAWSEKLECCQEHLGKDTDIDITTDKAGVYGKFLYDDYPPYLETWLKWRPRGLGIMPIRDYNIDFYHPNVIRWDGTNILEIEKVMRACYDRKSGEQCIV